MHADKTAHIIINFNLLSFVSPPGERSRVIQMTFKEVLRISSLFLLLMAQQTT